MERSHGMKQVRFFLILKNIYLIIISTEKYYGDHNS